jgi:NAD(P)-dependent dehydrogenase (short-subunit alcohol dehydrogenase family)
MSLQNKVAIVTGGGQGIGKAIAKRFLEERMKVVIADIDEEAGKETEAEFKHLGSIRFFNADVSDEDSVQNLIIETKRSFDGIDVLVNNAARSDPNNAPITELSLEDWNKILSINLTGAFLCTKHSVTHLKKNRGIIINIASTRALMSEANTEAYSAAKGGILALTHALAISLGPDIRVNCISPGWIEVSEWKKQATRHKPELTEQDHKQHPVGRVGKPEDVASLAVYLASPEATFITGENFVIDGGMTKKMIYW